MSLFHIAIAGNILSIMSVSTGYTIERKLQNVPEEVLDDLRRKVFYTANLRKSNWTKAGTNLDMSSPTRQYFLFERSEELRSLEEEYEVVSAMAKYADALPSLETTYE